MSLWKDPSVLYFPVERLIPDCFLDLPERAIVYQVGLVVESLKIEPGMNILDIGAGRGFFTFRFAQELKNTGKIFATEVSSERLNWIKRRIKRSGFKNILPVRVKPDGWDSFYKQYQFDIIFLSGVFPIFLNPESYFRELRPSLTKDKGRLYILAHKNKVDFHEVDFDGFKNTVKFLFSEGEGFPVFGRLDRKIQDFIRHWKGSDVPLEMQRTIFHNFNRMLFDRWLFNDLVEYYYTKGITQRKWLSPVSFLFAFDIRLAKWLSVNLEESGVFEKKEMNLTGQQQEELHALNKILLSGIFGLHKLYLLRWEAGYPIYRKKNAIIATLDSAGYEFVKEYDGFRQHYLLEFKSKL